MGEYNPHAPYILGQEWVGIRDETLTFEPTVNTSEQGHRFTLSTATQINHARTYITKVPPDGGNGAITAVSIYPAGGAALSGPIRVIDIPLSSASISGDSGAAIATVTVGGASNALGALFSQGLDSYVRFNGTFSDFRWVACLFDIGKYAGLIKDKRILNIQLLYTAGCSENLIELDPQQNFGVANSIFNTNVNLTPNASPFSSNGPFLGRLISSPDGYVTELGELNLHFGGQVPTNNINQTPDRMNWSYAELTRLAGLTSTFIYVVLGAAGTITLSDVIFLYFVGLRITYCDERRVLYGATAMGQGSFNNAYGKIAVPGAFTVPLRGVTTMTANTVLPAGVYDVVVSSATQATPLAPVDAFPPINALRELYSMPAHTPVKTRIPFPLDTAVGQTFQEQTTTILPQLSLHTTGGTIVNPHAYGRQVAAQVYGVNTAIQDIYDVPVGGAAPFPQVRYYARRFGQTTQSLLLNTTSPTISGSMISLTPAAFDALDTEVIDGWKDVTLRFASPPTMGTGLIPRWMWSSVGELASNRWEILGVSSHAITAIPSNALSLVASPNQTSTATYGQPISGSVVDLDWMPGLAPTVTGTTDDPSADAVLIFSQDPATVTGFAISLQSQAVTGFAECTSGSCCVPSAISYNQLTWTTPVGFGFDDYERVVAASWGTSTSGVVWVNAGGAAADHFVNGTYGQFSLPSTGASRREVFGAETYLDVETQIDTSVPVIAIGTAILTGLMLRYVDTANHYEAEVAWNSNGTVSVRLVSRVASSGVTLTETTVGSYDAGSWITVKARIVGSLFQAKAWLRGDVEPTFWQASSVTTAFTAAGTVGVRGELPSGNTNTTPVVVSYDNFTVSALPADALELQRMDTVDTEWQTIMLAENAWVDSFNDYEARVGVLSSYRIRRVNVLNFAGAWSITGTSTITEPGVTLPSCGASKRGVLIFTSNEAQDGSRNLAYAMTWDDSVVEDFDFPESGTIDIQRHHDRDYQVAFHGSERGGEQFSRRLLLANAAIALPRLGNTHSLRDLAWDDLPYVCVRDDIGDRWLATVIVPRAEARRKRRLYNADITVIEVTDTPSPVNP